MSILPFFAWKNYNGRLILLTFYLCFRLINKSENTCQQLRNPEAFNGLLKEKIKWFVFSCCYARQLDIV